MLTTAGADRVLTMDLHADQVHGFFSVPVDHLTAIPIIAAHSRRDLDLSTCTGAPPPPPGPWLLPRAGGPPPRHPDHRGALPARPRPLDLHRRRHRPRRRQTGPAVRQLARHPDGLHHE